MRQLSLFDEIDTGTQKEAQDKKKSRSEIFNDYDGFVDKFKAKKTTDDCYTPEPVYRAVLDFVETLIPLGGRPIIRPFFPGGDFVNHTYPPGCVVIDNPPFSILAKICRFYTGHDIPFFLFGPQLTLFAAPDCDLTYIIADADIRYENGAVVRTGFITNICPGIRIWCCPQLKKSIEAAQALPRKQLNRFAYPDHIVTAATLGKLTTHSTELIIPSRSCQHIKDSDAAKALGRSLWGGDTSYPTVPQQHGRQRSGRQRSGRQPASSTSRRASA